MLTMRASRPRRLVLQVGRLERGAVELKRLGGGELDAAAGVFPGAGERGQQGDGADGHGAAFGALHAVVQADRGGARGGVFAREIDDIVARGCR